MVLIERIGKTVNEYDRKAAEFCKKHGVKITSEFIGRTVPWWDNKNQSHNTYKTAVSCRGFTYETRFYTLLDMTKNNQQPEGYDILASYVRDTGAGYDTYKEFCEKFGYDPDTEGPKVEEAWHICGWESNAMHILFDKADTYAEFCDLW